VSAVTYLGWRGLERVELVGQVSRVTDGCMGRVFRLTNGRWVTESEVVTMEKLTNQSYADAKAAWDKDVSSIGPAPTGVIAKLLELEIDCDDDASLFAHDVDHGDAFIPTPEQENARIAAELIRGVQRNRRAMKRTEEAEVIVLPVATPGAYVDEFGEVKSTRPKGRPKRSNERDDYKAAVLDEINEEYKAGVLSSMARMIAASELAKANEAKAVCTCSVRMVALDGVCDACREKALDEATTDQALWDAAVARGDISLHVSRWYGRTDDKRRDVNVMSKPAGCSIGDFVAKASGELIFVGTRYHDWPELDAWAKSAYAEHCAAEAAAVDFPDFDAYQPASQPAQTALQTLGGQLDDLAVHPDGCFRRAPGTEESSVAREECWGDGHYLCADCANYTAKPEPCVLPGCGRPAATQAAAAERVKAKRATRKAQAEAVDELPPGDAPCSQCGRVSIAGLRDGLCMACERRKAAGLPPVTPDDLFSPTPTKRAKATAEPAPAKPATNQLSLFED
jgi:hypothetical protein